MFKVLRDEESDICMTGAIATTGSQVSVLAPNGTDTQSCHWLTATKYPHWSIFKPFVFCKDAVITDITVSPNSDVSDAGGFVDRKHKLYKAHEQFIKMLNSDDPRGKMLLETLKEMESKCIEDVEEMLKNVDAENSRQLAQIFQHMAQLEMNFYSM
jgi:secernin